MEISKIIDDELCSAGLDKGDVYARHAAHLALVLQCGPYIPSSTWNFKHVLEDFDVQDLLIIGTMQAVVRKALDAYITSETLR